MAREQSSAAQDLDLQPIRQEREIAESFEDENVRASFIQERRPVDRDTTERDLLRARRPPPTREEEIELAKKIEAAQRALVEAIARSPIAVDEIALVAAEVRDGLAEAFDLTTELLQDDADLGRVGGEVVEAAGRLRDAQRHPRTPSTADELRTARSHFVDVLLHHGLSHRAVERVLDGLVSDRAARRAGHKAVDDAIRRIRTSRARLDEAKALLVECNIGLVYWMVKRRGQTGLPLHDLVQEGTLGLMRAVEKFDYRRGVRFNTYAVWWIRHAINRALSDQSRTIRIPVHLLETRLKLTRVAQDFIHQRGRAPTDAELSGCTGLPEDKIRAVSTIPQEPLSMDAPLGVEGDAKLGDFVPDRAEGSALEEISAKHVQRRLLALLDTLTPREQQVIRLRFGLDQAETLTFEQIGRMLSLSRERIRQIEVEALSKLRGRAQAEDLDSHLSP